MICDSLVAKEVHLYIVNLNAICEDNIYVGILLISSPFSGSVFRLMAPSSLRENELFKIDKFLVFNISVDIHIYYLRVVVLLFRLL